MRVEGRPVVNKGCCVQPLELTIYSHEQHLLRLDDLNQLLKVGENLEHHGLLVIFDVSAVCMCAVMNNPIHVQVKIVDLRRTLRCCNLLVQQGVPF